MSKNRKFCLSWIGLIMRTSHRFIFCVLAVTAGCASSTPYLAREPLKDHLMNSNHMVHAVDHIGFAVSSLEEAIRFWTIGLGFILERQSEMGGSFILQVTGTADPSVRTAIVKGPDGSRVELLEYSQGDHHGITTPTASAIGSAHLALRVQDIYAVLERIEQAGWKARGKPQAIPAGPRKGTLVVYVTGPDHITLELMQANE
ncbi:VOC family protein [Pseudomonas sp. GNP013]